MANKVRGGLILLLVLVSALSVFIARGRYAAGVGLVSHSPLAVVAQEKIYRVSDQKREEIAALTDLQVESIGLPASSFYLDEQRAIREDPFLGDDSLVMYAEPQKGVFGGVVSLRLFLKNISDTDITILMKEFPSYSYKITAAAKIHSKDDVTLISNDRWFFTRWIRKNKRIDGKYGDDMLAVVVPANSYRVWDISLLNYFDKNDLLTIDTSGVLIYSVNVFFRKGSSSFRGDVYSSHFMSTIKNVSFHLSADEFSQIKEFEPLNYVDVNQYPKFKEDYLKDVEKSKSH